jgi:asparagine synthase (glutamine-hydrolysing)
VKEAGVSVALSGLGGDELFAGYPSFSRYRNSEMLRVIPRSLRTAAGRAGSRFYRHSVRSRKLWDLVASDLSPRSIYAISRQLFSPAEIAGLLRRPVASDAGGVEYDLVDPLNVISMYEMYGYMANTLLRDTDCMSMANSLEVRVPFIDPVVVQYVLSIPGDLKVSLLSPKPLLLQALSGMVPEEIWKRGKMGFTLPFERWLQSSLRHELELMLESSSLWDLGFDRGSVRGIVNRFANTPSWENWSRPWSLYAIGKWCELNQVSP